MRQQHDEAIQQQRQELIASREKKFSKLWNKSLGTPTLANLRYDADAELFLADVVSAAGFSLAISIPVPIGEAEAEKSRLASMRPWVLNSLQGDRLAPRVVLLQGSGETVHAKLKRTAINFSFNDAQVAAFNNQQAARAQADQKARDAQRREKAKRFPYVATFECTLNGGSMPFTACLRTDGRLEVRTTGGSQVLTLRDMMSSSIHVADLTQSFTAGAQVGTGSRFGSIAISVVDRLSGETVGRTVATGAGDYAIIQN